MRLQGLEQQFEQVSGQHHLKIYLVAAKQESDTGSSDVNPATAKLNDLIARWQGQPGFPLAEELTILWIRRSDNPNKGWGAANAGDRLRAEGLTPELFNAPDGPVRTAIKQYMPNNPKGAFAAIVNNVNQRLTDREQQIEAAKAQMAELRREYREAVKFLKLSLVYILKGGVIISLFWVGLLLYKRYHTSKMEALTTIAKWQERLNKADELYVRLYDSYFGFLKTRTDWETKFKGITLERYTAAVTDFAKLSARMQAARKRLEAAQTAYKGSICPLTNGFRTAVSLLTAEIITVTDEEIPLEIAKLFSGSVPVAQYAPERLLTDMSDLFERTNRVLTEITHSFESIETALSNIKSSLAESETLREQLLINRLSFAPYEAMLLTLQQNLEVMRVATSEDPVGMINDCLELSQSVESFLNVLKRAIALVDELTSVETEIARLVARVCAVRQSETEFVHLRSLTESRLVMHLHLNEVGGNPDPLVSKANEILQLAKVALVNGQLDESNTRQAEARKIVEEANRLIDDVVRAKDSIEQQVLVVQDQMASLTAWLPKAMQIMEQISSEFSPENLKELPNLLQSAQKQPEITGKVLEQIEQAYKEQQFLEGQRCLETLAKNINTHLANLALINNYLPQLRQAKSKTIKLISECWKVTEELQTKLDTNKFTTSVETGDRYKALVSQLQQESNSIDKKAVNWLKSVHTASEFREHFHTISFEIEQQEQAWQRAMQYVQQLEQAITEVHSVVFDSDTREEARQLLAKASLSVGKIRKSLEEPHSDWVQIGKQVTEAREATEQAWKLAQKDKELVEKARKKISQAKAAVASASSWGESVSSNLATTMTNLNSVESLLQTGNYLAAIEVAECASKAALDAESSARKEAESSSSRSYSSDDNDRYSSGYSGGGSYDSGFSGGGGYDGGFSGGGGY